MVRRLIILVAVLLIFGLAYNFQPELSLPAGAVADRMELYKSQRRLALFSHGKVIKNYVVALGSVPKGPKTCQGDKRTPEGSYTISGRNPQSSYYKALRVSYPSPADLARAKARKCKPGGDIMIHGLPNGRGWIGKWQRRWDWTQGCIALTNSEMDELWRAVKVGTPIVIRP